MKNYGFIYLTTNIKNGMKYIGQTHYRDKMDPFYFGSGKAIKRAIKKNGKHCFIRETIFEAFTKNDLDWAEIHFILEFNAGKSRKFYNIAPGGRASLGFTGKKHTAERNANLSKQMLENHPRAKSVTVNGKTFKTIGEAVKEYEHKFSRAKILKWAETGIHPDYQSHGSRGLQKTIPSPTTKTWLLEKDDGSIIEVFGLLPWCRRNNLNHHQILKSRERGFYQGYRLIAH